MKDLNNKITYTGNKHYERIILTNNCNLRCKYCFQTFKKHDLLSYENLSKRIELLNYRLNDIDNLSLNLFGGEPLLNWNGFSFILDEFKNNKKVNLSTITNGTLLNEERIRYLSEFDNFSLDLSMDGNKFGNSWRIIGNENSFDNLLNNLILFNKFNIMYKIRMTVGKFNVMYVLDSLKMFDSIGVKTVYIQCVSFPEQQQLDQNEIDLILSYKDLFSNMKVEYFGTNCKVQSYKQSDRWYITQPNGVTYSYMQCESLGVLDSKMYQISYDEDLSYTNIIDILDLNDLRYKVLKEENGNE